MPPRIKQCRACQAPNKMPHRNLRTAHSHGLGDQRLRSVRSILTEMHAARHPQSSGICSAERHHGPFSRQATTLYQAHELPAPTACPTAPSSRSALPRSRQRPACLRRLDRQWRRYLHGDGRKPASPGASDARRRTRESPESTSMMRFILVGILVLMAAGIGLMTFDWYRQTNERRALWRALCACGPQGRRRSPRRLSAATPPRCSSASPTARKSARRRCSRLDGWLKKLGDEGKDIRAYFVTVDPERDTADMMDSYVSNVSDRITGITGEPDKVHADGQGLQIFARKVRSRRRRLHDGSHGFRPPA